MIKAATPYALPLCSHQLLPLMPHLRSGTMIVERAAVRQSYWMMLSATWLECLETCFLYPKKACSKAKLGWWGEVHTSGTPWYLWSDLQFDNFSWCDAWQIETKLHIFGSESFQGIQDTGQWQWAKAPRQLWDHRGYKRYKRCNMLVGCVAKLWCSAGRSVQWHSWLPKY